jgi:hypothetical protein
MEEYLVRIYREYLVKVRGGGWSRYRRQFLGKVQSGVSCKSAAKIKTEGNTRRSIC